MGDLRIRQLHPTFGVEINGLEPCVPLDDATLQTLKQLLDEKALLVFRDINVDKPFQNYISHAVIGRAVPPARDAVAEKREAFVSNKEENGIAPFGRLLFHSDMMWCEDACEVISLYGVDVEQPSPPTLFVSAAEAWKTLAPHLRARVEGRLAEHVHDLSYERSGGDADVLTAQFADQDCVRFPIDRPNPRTGQALLYVCQQMTSGIADMAKGESEALLEELFRHLYAPQNVFEHHWRKGDLVLWDNLALQHARPNVKSEGPARTLRKIFAPFPQSLMTKLPQFTRAAERA
jgi:alpha-ketoglutarate-dependent taurine dioxygenase